MKQIDILQQHAFDKFSKLKVGALFMKPGSGKTKVAMALIKHKELDTDYIVWIAPACILNSENYQQEIQKWIEYCGINKPFLFFTAEGIASAKTKFLELHGLVHKNKCFCVIDESLKIKNLIAKKVKRLLSVSHLFKFKLILNGTPITKGLHDLYPQIEFLSPKILNMGEKEFAKRFLEYTLDGQSRSWTKWSRPHNEEALIEILRPYIFDEDLEKYSDLNQTERVFKLNKAEIKKYSKEKFEVLENFSKTESGISFLGLAQKLKQIYEPCKASLKGIKQDVENIMERNEKVIIYISFIKQVEIMQNLFGKDKVAIYTGENKSGLSEFKDFKNIMVCTYGCGSLGLNLQFANNIIYFSQTFDYKDKEQSLHRIYRTGQSKTCNIINYLVDTGLCNLIWASLDKKQNCLNNIKNFIQNNGINEL